MTATLGLRLVVELAKMLGALWAFVLKFRWVALALLALGSYFVVARAEKLRSPDPVVEVSLDQLLHSPPMGERVRVACDKLEPYGSVYETHRMRGDPPAASQVGETTMVVAICDLGDYFLPVTLQPGTNIQAPLTGEVVEGKLRRAVGDEVWMKQGIKKDQVINGANFNVYVDTLPEEHRLETALLVTGGIVLLIMWIGWFASFRGRRQQVREAASTAPANPVSAVGARARATGSTTPPPSALAGKVPRAVALCDISGGGLDARREDGSSILITWAEVAAIVARRLPPSHGGALFVEVHSMSGETMRILPWTRVTGDRLACTEDTRPRVLVQTFASRAPSAELDAATQRFLAGDPADHIVDLDV